MGSSVSTAAGISRATEAEGHRLYRRLDVFLLGFTGLVNAVHNQH
jgi:hypothetical protein